MNNDLIIDRALSQDSISINGRVRGLPMYSLEILNSSLELEKDYSRESIYEIRTTRSLEVRAPQQISYEGSGTIELSLSSTGAEELSFLAYPLIVELEDFGCSRSVSEQGMIILDTCGLYLNQLLCYIYKGMPVAVYTEDGSYCFIYGYDNSNIRIYLPSAGEDQEREFVMGREEAQDWLRRLNHNSVSAVVY